MEIDSWKENLTRASASVMAVFAWNTIERVEVK